MAKHMHTTDGQKPAQNKITAIIKVPPPSSKKRGTILYWNDQLPNKIFSMIN